jgi:hypothetical protein
MLIQQLNSIGQKRVILWINAKRDNSFPIYRGTKILVLNLIS